MRPFVSPISPTWMNSVGSFAKFPTNHTPTRASSGNPTSAVTLDVTEPFERSLKCRDHQVKNLNESRERS